MNPAATRYDVRYPSTSDPLCRVVLAAIVASTARKIAPPTCWAVGMSPPARPRSTAVTALVMPTETAGNTSAPPKGVRISPGSTCVR